MIKKNIHKIPLSKISIDNEIKKSVLSVLDEGNFILGKHTREFESKFAKFCNTKYSACVGSGTAALFLSLKSLGVKKDDEIIVPSMSFVASATPILMCGAKPKFVDIDIQTYNLDPKKIQNKITKKTKGIIPVHLYGNPVDMDKIRKIAKENSLFVLEDAAQAHGASYKKRMIGSLGDVSCFSFYPSKNLTVCGDGGIVLSNNKEIIDNVKKLRNHGRAEKYVHHVLGYNLRFNEIQAVIGKIMLKHLNKFNSNRRKISKIYTKLMKDVVITPKENECGKHVYHMYTIRTEKRDKLRKILTKNGIATGIHYPLPIHRQPIFKKFEKGKLPITDLISRTTLSLPMYPSLKPEEAEYISKKVIEFFT